MRAPIKISSIGTKIFGAFFVLSVIVGALGATATACSTQPAASLWTPMTVR